MPSRRSFVLGGLGALFVAACSDDEPSASPSTTTSTATEPPPSSPPSTSGTTGTTEPSSPSSPTALTPDDFAELAVCMLLPEEVEGPFYLDEDLVRRDLTEGHPGHPLRLGMMIVDETCTIIEDAAVDVWHADVDGDYSGFGGGGAGSTFLRGTQVTDRNGIVEFGTVYPGWYPGRTVHIHVKVHIEDSTVLTTQLVFEDGFSDGVYASAPYAGRGDRDTRNDQDPIIGDYRSNGTLLTTRSDGAGTLALVIIGVDPSGGGTARPIL